MKTDDISVCAAELADGELVAFPTETVFGLGARADSAEAVIKIFEAKGRPQDHPLIAHASSTDMALSVSDDIPEYARKLAEAFWPGPLTLIFESNENQVCRHARGGHDTVAVRVPSHPCALKLLSECDFLVVAPSANRFGRVSPTTADHVEHEFPDILILDGDRSDVGVESTIVLCVEDVPRILRSGKVTAQDIHQETGIIPVIENGSNVAAPGTLDSHYAPSIPVYVFENEASIALNVAIDPLTSAYLSLDEPNLVYKMVGTPDTLDAYAHDLYAFFRTAEDEGCSCICVIAPESEGVGVAINDRLTRAAYSYSESAS